MAQARSNLAGLFSRFLKTVIVFLLLPLPIGLLYGILDQLQAIQITGLAARHWVVSGFLAYAGCHVLLYRPVALFKAGQWVFSTLAVWLFGGQVSSTETAGVEGGKGKAGRGAKGPKGDAASQGSPLVAFSPYVIPVYTVIVCGLAWLASRWVDRQFIDAPAATLIGITTAFHWMMTADSLQPQRERWHVETYLLAIGLVFLLTLVIGGACLWWALPDYSHYNALSDGWTNAVGMYRAVIRRLFF